MYADPKIWAEVRHRALIDGESIRSISKVACLSRNTVRKMLRQSQPVPYHRKASQTLISGYETTINSMLKEDDARPQRERKSILDVFRLLRDDHGYVGGYSSVYRYCRSVQAPVIIVEVRPAGDAECIESLTITKLTRVYRLNLESGPGATGIGLRLHRDRRSERADEVARWIDRLRADQLDVPLRGDPHALEHLLRCVHGTGIRTRNRAITVLAHEQGFPIRRIAAHLGMSRNTVRRHITSYSEGGAEKLLAPIKRKPTGVDRDTLKEALFRLLHEPPKVHGINRTSWIMADLRMVLAHQGLPACLQVIRQIIHDAGWKWRKARIVLTSQDPAYREKVAAIQAILSNLGSDEAFFSIDEFGPFAVKMKQGLRLGPPGPPQIVPQWQKSKGCMIMTAALELSSNQVTHFYSDRKNTTEMIRMMEMLLVHYADRRTLYLSWDAASWHVSKKLMNRVEEHNASAEAGGLPRVEIAPLPAGAQFLNVIESIFSGMAKAIIHNSDYPSVDAVRTAIDGYFAKRNQQFRDKPQRAGKRIWGEERVPPAFSSSNNCKDPSWR